MLTRRLGVATVWNGNVLSRDNFQLTSYRYYSEPRPFGSRQSYLLAERVHSLGREQFARFWTSNETVPKAFEQAAGESLDKWTSHWIASQYGPVPARGAGVTGWAWLMSGVLIAIALLIAVRASVHRQFA